MQKRLHENRKLIGSVLLFMIAIAILTYITAAWLLDLSSLNSAAQVQVPSKITILNGDKSEMQQIDLTYTDSDLDGSVVTLKKPICIESSSNNFNLELSYTTNIKGMTCTLYRTDDETAKNLCSVTPSEIPLEDSAKIKGEFLNKNSNVIIADESGKWHDATYGDTTLNVQENAEPLYWMSEEQSLNGGNFDNSTSTYFAYYILVITWDSNTKETDMVYLMAAHV